MNKNTVEVTFKDGVSQKYQVNRNSSLNDRFIKLYSKDREFYFNSDVIECIEVLKEEEK